MKYIFFFLLLISGTAYSQSTYYIRADSTRLQKVGGNNELIIENSTRTLTGAYLKNNLSGRTTFDYAVDSGSIAGSNLTLWRGNGTQNIVIALPGGGGGGTVTEVFGTANRITVATGTTTPVVDIAATYVGQTSIITVGALSTGSAVTGFTIGDVTMNVTGTDATGDVYYRNASGILTRLAIGTSGQGLTVSGGGLPTWTTLGGGSGTVTSIDVSGGTTGLTTSGGPVTTTGTITIAGTLITTNGGTGLSSWTQGDLPYYTSSTALSKLAKDANATRYLSNQGASNAPSWNQVNLANGVTGNLPVTNLNSGTSASATTFWRGDGTWGTPAGSGTVTSVSFTGGLISVATATTTPAFTVAGTSGGIPYFSSTSTWASSALLAANAIMIGGGAGTAPATTTTASGILTWIGTPSSANLRGALTDENGTGAALFNAATTPDFTTGFTISTAATSRKMIVGNGTNFVPSTETWAVPGTTGNVLTSDGTNWTSAAPATSGTVTAVSVATANGFAGTSSGGATPALTLSTTITGMLKGNGTAISAATSGTDYSAGTSALATGILRSTTTTGTLSIATDGTHYLSPTTGWATVTNAGLVHNTNNFFGTATNVAILFRVNGQPWGGWFPSGGANIGLNAAGGTSMGANAGANDVSSAQEGAYFGYGSGRYNIDGNKNAFFGLYGKTVHGSENSFVGAHASESGNTGSTNSGIGYSVLRWNRNGSNNNGLGGLSLYLNTTVVESVTITNGGTGYGGTPPTVTFTTPPASVIPGIPHVLATGTAIVDGGGVVTGVTITNNGSGYGWETDYGLSAATVTFSGGSGSGATGTINLASGDGNTAAGQSSLAYSEWGDNNAAFGRAAGYGAGGNEASYFDDNSLFLGYLSSRHSSIARTTKLTNATAIGYNAKVSVSNGIVLGDPTVAMKVGIGLHNPTATFDISTPATTTIGSRVTANSLTTGQAAWISSSSVTNGNLLYLGSSSTAVPGNTATSAAMYFDITGANASSNVGRYGQYVGVTASGTASSNVGSYYNVGNATNNYAILVQNGTVGIGVLTPTANLHLKAGAAAAGSAPLKLNTGTAMTTPEDGAFEYHTSHLYFTIGSTRYQLDQQSGGGGATVALDNLSAVAINAALVLGTSDAFALGSTTKQWSDLFLAEGGVINWDNGDATLTQVGDVVTLAGADLKVTTPGNAATSVLTTDATQTLTNKRITARVGSTTSSATPTINTDNVEFYHLTAQTADITSFTTNLSGTPTTDQVLHIAVTGTAARAITFGSSFEASSIPLPTTTISTNRLDMYFIWNAVTSKWRITGAF